MAFISIIVPAYNCESTLERCLDSILVQEYKDFEVLLVDDGSRDGTPTICDHYATRDSRIRVFHKKNGGASSARNTGLENVTGEWVTFVDSDDSVSDIWLSAIVKCIKETSQQQCLFVTDFAFIQDAEGKDIVPIRFDKSINTWKGLFDTGIWQNVWNKVFNYEIIREKNIGFDENFRFFEDALFVGAYLEYCPTIKVIGEICYNHFFLSSYSEKYRNNLTADGYSQFYMRMGELNQEMQKEIVDDVFMRFVKMGWDVHKLKSLIGKDIKYVKGRRKFAVRYLSAIDSYGVWRIVIGLMKAFIVK